MISLKYVLPLAGKFYNFASSRILCLHIISFQGKGVNTIFSKEEIYVYFKKESSRHDLSGNGHAYGDRSLPCTCSDQHPSGE